MYADAEISEKQKMKYIADKYNFDPALRSKWPLIAAANKMLNMFILK